MKEFLFTVDQDFMIKYLKKKEHTSCGIIHQLLTCVILPVCHLLKSAPYIKTQYLPYCRKSKSGREMMPFMPLEFIARLLAGCIKLWSLVFLDVLIWKRVQVEVWPSGPFATTLLFQHPFNVTSLGSNHWGTNEEQCLLISAYVSLPKTLLTLQRYSACS